MQPTWRTAGTRGIKISLGGMAGICRKNNHIAHPTVSSHRIASTLNYDKSLDFLDQGRLDAPLGTRLCRGEKIDASQLCNVIATFSISQNKPDLRYIIPFKSSTFTYNHRLKRIGHPVGSANTTNFAKAEPTGCPGGTCVEGAIQTKTMTVQTCFLYIVLNLS